VRIFCSFLRVLSISQDLVTETFANDLITNKNSMYWSRNFSLACCEQLSACEGVYSDEIVCP